MKPALSDVKMVKMVLAHAKLTTAQRAAFQGMYDHLATGTTVGLSLKQRQWVHQVFRENKLGDRELPPARPVSVQDKTLTGRASALDAMPKPLKPPGKS